MNRAAIGIRAHSGWAAAVAVSGNLSAPKILHRQRISAVESGARGTFQPYHFAKGLPLKRRRGAPGCLCQSGPASGCRRPGSNPGNRARFGTRDLGLRYPDCVGAPVPGLAETLASHAMNHTAEGEFFRSSFAEACGDLDIPLTKFRERELLDRAARALRVAPAKIKIQLTHVGRELGPPWTQGQEKAALVGWLRLGGGGKTAHR
jgi:hypothetical protein